MLLCAGAVIILIAIVVICIKCRKQGKITHNIADNVDAASYPGHSNKTDENDRSLQLEDMDDEHNNS